MAKIECTNDQLRLIQKALDFYSRVGMGQFNEIVEHPTFEKSLHRQFSPNKLFEVGDQTMRGEITKITKNAIWTKGHWGNGEEIKKWTDIENIQYSPDWEKLHEKEDEVKSQLNIARNLLYGEEMGRNGNWGIYNNQVDESCREAFEIIQKIQGVELAEIELTDECFPYQSFALNRFGIYKEDMEKFMQMLKDCTELNDIEIGNLIEELSLELI